MRDRWSMLWVKAFHIVFVTSWFAGLFYLPRIFVNLALLPAGASSAPAPRETGLTAEHARLLLMARKLYRFMQPLMGLALLTGLWLWLGYGIGTGPGNRWLIVKLVAVVVLIGYHHGCGVLLKRFEAGRNSHSHRWYRWFNEMPVMLLLVAVIMVVVKPF